MPVSKCSPHVSSFNFTVVEVVSSFSLAVFFSKQLWNYVWSIWRACILLGCKDRGIFICKVRKGWMDGWVNAERILRTTSKGWSLISEQVISLQPNQTAIEPPYLEWQDVRLIKIKHGWFFYLSISHPINGAMRYHLKFESPHELYLRRTLKLSS